MGIEETVVVVNIITAGVGDVGIGIGGVMGILVVSTASAAIIDIICRIVATQSA